MKFTSTAWKEARRLQALALQQKGWKQTEIAEALGVKLTERMMKELEDNGLQVGNLVVNYLVRDEDCPFHKIRKEMQEHYIEVLKAVCSGRNMVTLYLSPYEIKGLERIGEISHALFSDGD